MNHLNIVNLTSLWLNRTNYVFCAHHQYYNYLYQESLKFSWMNEMQIDIVEVNQLSTQLGRGWGICNTFAHKFQVHLFSDFTAALS